MVRLNIPRKTASVICSLADTYGKNDCTDAADFIRQEDM
jgi:hypothetical protein